LHGKRKPTVWALGGSAATPQLVSQSGEGSSLSTVRPMPGTAHLSCYAEAKNEKGAAKVAERVAAAFHHRLDVTAVKPYWKIEGQWEIGGKLELEASSLAAAVVEMLRLADGLSHRWDVNCPVETSEGSWHFDGYATGDLRVSGVVFAHWMFSPI
jgi:hypothetical protein